MKKYLIIVALLLNSAAIVYAQNCCPQGGENCPKRNNEQMYHEKGNKPHPIDENKYSPETIAMMRADRLAEKLKLSDDVKKKVIEQFTKEEKEKLQHRQKMDAFREQERKAKEIEKEKNEAALEKIIGTEKMQELKAMREKQKQKQATNSQRTKTNH